jgi:four helix bundle protein
MKNTRVSEYQNKQGNSDESLAGFEKLWVWQKAHELMQEICTLCKTLPKAERFRLADQIERSSSSVCDNMAEGYTAYYYNDKIKGFLTARKEAGETQNHVRKLSAKGYINQERAQELVGKYEEIIRGINGFVNYIRKKRGTKR